MAETTNGNATNRCTQKSAANPEQSLRKQIRKVTINAVATIYGMCQMAKWYAQAGDCDRAVLILEQAWQITDAIFGKPPQEKSQDTQLRQDNSGQRQDFRDLARIRAYDQIDKARATVERVLCS